MQKKIVLPEIAENIHTAVVGAILISVGDSVVADQTLLEVETEKAVSAIPASHSGKIVGIEVKEGDTIEVGTVLVVLELSEHAVTEDIPMVTETEKPNESDVLSDLIEVSEQELPLTHQPEKTLKHAVLVPASPSVRRLAREIGVDITQVQGTGAGDRITTQDVKDYAKSLLQGKNSSEIVGGRIELPDFSVFGDIENVPFTKVRSVTARNMSLSWQTVPQVTQFDKANVRQLDDFRKEYKSLNGNEISLSAILVKVVGIALQKFPQFNASIDIEQQQTIYKKYYNVGVAVDTENGLLVPVVKDVEQKGMEKIAEELKDLVTKAKNKKLSLSEMSGGNFTISNLGGIGGTSFTPIVYAPQVAILGVSSTQEEVEVRGGEVQMRRMLPLSLSYDHRIIDGADAARFLRWLCNALEHPFNVLL